MLERGGALLYLKHGYRYNGDDHIVLHFLIQREKESACQHRFPSQQEVRGMWFPLRDAGSVVTGFQLGNQSAASSLLSQCS